MKKRKALTINRLALGSLRTHGRQYIALTLGIVLAIFFASGMLLMGSSMIHTLREQHNQRVGSQDVALLDAEQVTPEMLVQEGWAQKVGSIYVLGDIPRKVSYYEDKPALVVGYYDQQAAEFMHRQYLKGRMPAKPGEIAIERLALNQMRLEAELGDTIELELRIPKGNGEFLDKTVKKRYTLVGVLNEQRENMYDGNRWMEGTYSEYPSALVSDQEMVEPGGRAAVHRLLTLKPGVNLAELERYARNHGCDGMDTFPFSWANGLDGNKLLIEMLVLVLVLAACMGIVNAFSMRLNERRTQIGMLRAVGATRRQIRRIFGREALLIALVSAPLAVGLSCLAVWGICEAIGYVFYLTPLFLAADLLTSLGCVMLAALFPLMDISRISPMQAVRESALLRMKRRIRVRPKAEFRVPALLARRHRKLYPHKQAGISLMIALGMLIIVLGYGGADWRAQRGKNDPDKAFTMEVFLGAEGGFIDVIGDRSLYTENDYLDIAALPMVERVERMAVLGAVNLALPEVTDYLLRRNEVWDTSSFTYLLEAPTDAIYQNQDEYLHWQWERENYLKFLEQQPHDGQVIFRRLVAYDETILRELEQYVVGGEFDMDAINRGEEVIIVAPQSIGLIVERDQEGGILTDWRPNPAQPEECDIVVKNDMFFAGDELKLSHLTRGPQEYNEGDYTTDVRRKDWQGRIGAVIDPYTDGSHTSILGYYEEGDILTSLAGLSAMGFESYGYDGFAVVLSGAPDDKTAEYLSHELESIAQRSIDAYFHDRLIEVREGYRAENQLFMFAAAFIILFFAISVSMVSNALTNRLRADRRAIGTLRAVGASMGDIVESYLRQLAGMMGWGALLGVLIFLLGIEGLYWIGGGGGIGYIPYLFKKLPWWGLILMECVYLLLIFGVCVLNLRVRLKGVMRAGIVDNIREL